MELGWMEFQHVRRSRKEEAVKLPHESINERANRLAKARHDYRKDNIYIVRDPTRRYKSTRRHLQAEEVEVTNRQATGRSDSRGGFATPGRRLQPSNVNHAAIVQSPAEHMKTLSYAYVGMLGRTHVTPSGQQPRKQLRVKGKNDSSKPQDCTRQR